MRSTEAEVLELLDTELEAEQITPFLRMSNIVITKAIGSDEDYTEEERGQLECVLAAHLASIRDPRVVSETIGDAKATYHGKSGIGLDHTPWGQQLRVIDIPGHLVAALLGFLAARIDATP